MCAYAAERGLIVVAKDSDFDDFAVQRGNCSTREIADLLLEHADIIRALPGSETAVLALR